MDTIDRSESNLPARFPVVPSPLPALAPVFSGDLATTSPPQINSGVLRRALTRYWWIILLVWIGLSGLALCLIFCFVEPTFEAVSVLRIEPAERDLYTPSGPDMIESRSVRTYLQTQVNIITSDKVLGSAITKPEILNLSMIKGSKDSKNDLRKLMLVEVVKDAYLIKVALELSDGEQAKSIVNAVVDSYLKYNNDFKLGGNKQYRDNLVEQERDLGNEVRAKEAQLKALYGKGTVDPVESVLQLNATKNDDDTTKPTFKNVTMEQSQIIVGEMMRTDLDLIETKANLKATRDAVSRANEEDKGQQTRLTDEQEHRIQEEFRKDPEVIALTDDLAAAAEQRDHVRSLARQPNDPARRAAEARYNKLWDEYEKLWKNRHDEIGKQLKNAVAGTPRAAEVINDLELKVDALKAKQEEQKRLFEALKIEKKAVNNDVFDATVVKYQLQILLKRVEAVTANLHTLNFKEKQEMFRVTQVDPAVAPKSSTDNKRFKYMAAAPVALLFMVLGLAFLLEVKAERIADPDTLSTRVRSEVYGLPPLSTTRAIRKLSATEVEDQIEQISQRLDHLRFAVCGNPSELGRGRCVMITSAVGNEGKTTLASLLAERCGKAGMSTLLIEADLRRPTLCTLLEVPEGLGLSDILKDEAKIEEVLIPIQGETFDLLPAGTPYKDISRVLQSHKLGVLITRLRQDYNLIIIDSPPVLPVPDALILGQWVDGAVLTTRFDVSRFSQVERARRQLDNAGIAIMGTVINGMRHTDSYYGRYSYSRQRSTQPSSSDTI